MPETIVREAGHGARDARAAGALAIPALMAAIWASADADFDQMLAAGGVIGEGDDPRDYSKLTGLVELALADYAQANPERRLGFAAALAELLCINAEGCGAGLNWVPMAANRDRAKQIADGGLVSPRQED